MRFLILLISLTAVATLLPAQSDTLILQNPSFEGLPRYGVTPTGWTDCGQPGETPPDLHPSGIFGVLQAPADGQSYLGLVARDNATWEAVGQTLSTPLQAGRCYQWTLLAARSEEYVSVSRARNQVANYGSPLILRVWGTTGDPCRRLDPLAESPPIGHTGWGAYTFFFQPERELSGLILEAYYRPDTLAPYNGNVLVDYAQPIKPFPCEELDDFQLSGILPSRAERGLPAPPPPPRDGSELEAIVRQLAPQVRFLHTWPVTEQHAYQEPGGDLFFGNHYLRLLSDALRALPAATLTIGIDRAEHLAGYDVLAAVLRAELIRLDAPANIRIQKIQRRDRRGDWTVKGGRLYWRVE